MTATAPILVVTEALADALLVKKLLEDEFDNVALSTKPELAVQDFEKHRPAVLILAFDTLEQAETYYLGLFRLSTIVHSVHHQTLILCNKHDLWRVYELCKKQHFDDYILFWPATNDAPRLRMAVHHALRQLRTAGSSPTASGQLAAQVRELAALEKQLSNYAAEGEQRSDVAKATIAQAQQALIRARGDMSMLSVDKSPGVAIAQEHGRSQQEADHRKIEEMGQHFDSVAAAVDTLSQWATGFATELSPQLESARALQSMIEQIRPTILMVDDDELQHLLLKKLLDAFDIDLLFVSSGLEALAILRRHRPDLILMDVDLPDVDGLDVTRRIKAVKYLSAIPVIMITGHSEKAVVIESLKAGAADFVVKPFDRAALITKVGKFLDMPGKPSGSVDSPAHPSTPDSLAH